MHAPAQIEQEVAAAQASGFFTHCYIACGRLDAEAPLYELSRSPDQATLFDLASLTKALVTGPLVFQLLQERGLELTSSLRSWAPPSLRLRADVLELSTAAVLGHFSGLPAWWNFWVNHLGSHRKHLGWRERQTLVTTVLERLPALGPPQDLYSDVGYILLGTLLEAVNGGLDQQWRQLKTLLQCPEPALDFALDAVAAASDFVPTSYCQLRERGLRGEVHDENCAALGGVAGHAGLFGSGRALIAYLQALYQQTLGRAYLEANQRALTLGNHEGLLGLRRGSGASAEVFAGGRAMGHLGFTGTAFWIDLPRGHYAVFLSNRVISGRVNPAITGLRRSIFASLYDILA